MLKRPGGSFATPTTVLTYKSSKTILFAKSTLFGRNSSKNPFFPEDIGAQGPLRGCSAILLQHLSTS